MTASQMAHLGDRVRLGVRIAIALAVLTVVEYLVAVTIDDPLRWLVPFILAKGWLILDYFMHVRDLRPGGGT